MDPNKNSRLSSGLIISLNKTDSTDSSLLCSHVVLYTNKECSGEDQRLRLVTRKSPLVFHIPFANGRTKFCWRCIACVCGPITSQKYSGITLLLQSESSEKALHGGAQGPPATMALIKWHSLHRPGAHGVSLLTTGNCQHFTKQSPKHTSFGKFWLTLIVVAIALPKSLLPKVQPIRATWGPADRHLQEWWPLQAHYRDNLSAGSNTCVPISSLVTSDS